MKTQDCLDCVFFNLSNKCEQGHKPRFYERAMNDLLKAAVGELVADLDTMQDVYMSCAQREAYDRIVVLAKQAKRMEALDKLTKMAQEDGLYDDPPVARTLPDALNAAVVKESFTTQAERIDAGNSPKRADTKNSFVDANKKIWAGLTPAEILDTFLCLERWPDQQLALAIEAKLKEKNT